MRKIVIAVMSTLSAVVMLFAFDASRRDATVVTAAPVSLDGEEAAADADPSAAGADPSATDGDPSATETGAAKSTKKSKSATKSATKSAKSTSKSAAKTSPEAAKASSKTYTGGVVNTEYGPVQVRIVVKDGKIVRAAALQFPTGGKSDQINGNAIPQLQKSTVANNGQVDAVSGATITSGAYRTSLQSALDKADL